MLRLIDAAIRQAQEPINCQCCGSPLTGSESVLYFCGIGCQNQWRRETGLVVTPVSGFRPDYPWRGELPSEPDVRYPEANNGAARDYESASILWSYSERWSSRSQWRESLQMWFDDPHYCPSCLSSVSCMLNVLGRPTPDSIDDMAHSYPPPNRLLVWVEDVLRSTRSLADGQAAAGVARS